MRRSAFPIVFVALLLAVLSISCAPESADTPAQAETVADTGDAAEPVETEPAETEPTETEPGENETEDADLKDDADSEEEPLVEEEPDSQEKPELVISEVPAQLEEFYRTYYKAYWGGEYFPPTHPPYWVAVNHFSSGDIKVRGYARDYLMEMLKKALADEYGDSSYWDGLEISERAGLCASRRIRWYTAQTLEEGARSAEAVPVLEFFLYDDVAPNFQELAAMAFPGVEGEDANRLIVEVISEPHENGAVVSRALEVAAERKLPVPEKTVAALLQHRRAVVREAAAALYMAFDYGKPEPFDAVAALESEAVRAIFAAISEIVVEEIPDNADFVHFENVDTGFSMLGRGTFLGWLLEENDDGFEVFSNYGFVEFVEKRDDGEGPRIAGRNAVGEEVDKIVALYANTESTTGTFEHGAVTYTYRGHHSSNMYEYSATYFRGVLANRLYESGKKELAAKVIFALINSVDLDSHLIKDLKDDFADVCYHRMIASFIGDRDYEAALKWAGIIAERFKGGEYYDDAAQFLDELPRRMDDFREMRLPTAEEWEKAKDGLSREERIHYWCRRIRLLEGAQWSQPGFVMTTPELYAEPPGMSRNAARPLGRGRTVVLNPKTMLKAEELNLGISDIPLIAPHLKDDWLILAVGFHRDFKAERYLYSTRGTFVSLINRIAGEEICDWDELYGLSEEETEAYIAGIILWARNKSAGENPGD